VSETATLSVSGTINPGQIFVTDPRTVMIQAPRPEPEKSYRYIKIETVKNGYIVHAAEHDHPMNMACNQFVFRSVVELGKWVEKHAGYYEE